MDLPFPKIIALVKKMQIPIFLTNEPIQAIYWKMNGPND